MSQNNTISRDLNPQVNRRRYRILILAALLNFPTGAAALWSIFQPMAKEIYSLPQGSANMPFSVFMIAFVFGNICGGMSLNRFKPKTVILLANIIMMIGIFTMGMVPVGQPWLLSVTFGALGGFGAGAGYNAVLATISKWFPDRKGFATGLIVFMVGAHGLIMAPIGNALLNSLGFRNSAIVIAVGYAVIFFICLPFVHVPQDGFMSDYVPAGANAMASRKNYTVKEMVRTKEFYLITCAMAFGTAAYFILNPMVKSLGMERDLSEATATGAIMILSIANCLARLLVPTMSDKFGRTPMLIITFAVCLAAVIGMMSATGMLYLICTFFVAFSYGASFGLFPSVVMDNFGPKNSGANYGVVMIGYGIVCLICPSLVNAGVNVAFTAADAAVIIGIILVLLLARLNKKNRQDEA